MAKIKVNFTIREETLRSIENMTRNLFPPVVLSKGDVIDLLVSEKIDGLFTKPEVSLIQANEEKEGCENESSRR